MNKSLEQTGTATSILPTSIFNSIVKMLSVSISFFVGIHFVNIGLTGIQIGIIFAIGTVTGILTILPSGFSNDTFKSKHLVGLGMALMTIMYLGLSSTTSFTAIAILFFIGEGGKTIYNTSTESLFYKSTNKENVPRKIGTYQGLMNLTLGLGMMLAGYLLKIGIPIEKLFLGIGIIFAFLTITSQIILPKLATSKFEIIHYKKDILNKQVLIFLLIVFLFSIHFGSEITSYGLFLKNNLQLDSLQMGLYMGISVIFMAITSVVLAKKFKQWKPKNILLIGLLLSGLGHILMTITIAEISLIFRIIHEVGDSAMFFFIFYGITTLFSTKRVGGNAGIFTFTTTIGNAIGALIFGPLGSAFGYNFPLLISGTVTVIGFIIALRFTKYFNHE